MTGTFSTQCRNWYRSLFFIFGLNKFLSPLFFYQFICPVFTFSDNIQEIVVNQLIF